MLLLAHNRLRLSDRAQAKIRSVLEERGETDATVRLFAERASDGAIELGLAFDRRRDDDVVVPAEGVTVLADAQTSGGLLMAVAEDRADQLVGALKERGTRAAVVVGKVIAKREQTIRLV